MLINDIVNRINRKLAGEMLSYSQLIDHMDAAIDDINSELGSIYPAFSELDSSEAEYNYFPDEWIRKVVIPGAAWYFFVTDEEGIVTATQFQYDYSRNLYIMVRDFFSLVPEAYRSPDNSGIIFESEQETGERGINFVHSTLIP